METQTDRYRLGAFFYGLVEHLLLALAPRKSRRVFFIEMADSYRSPRRWLQKAPRDLFGHVRAELHRSLNVRLIAAEVCGLMFCFPQLTVPLILILAASVLGLALRDAYRFPAIPTPKEVVHETIAAVAFIVLSQLVAGGIWPSMALSATDLRRGAALAYLVISAARLYFRRTPAYALATEAGLMLAFEAYYRASRINLLWMAAGLAIAKTTPEALPQSWISYHGPILVLTMGAFAVAYRLQRTGRLLLAPEQNPLFRDPYKDELQRKRDMLWRPTAGWASHTAEAVGLLLLLSPLVLASWARASGYANNIDAYRLAANMSAVLGLTIVWPFVRKMNGLAIDTLQAKIDSLEGQESR